MYIFEIVQRIVL